MKGFEENEISKNANGGTEITKRKLAAEIDQELLEEFQIIPSRVRGLQDDKIRIYWAHDLPGDPECDFFKKSEELEKFHKIAFSSNWQYQMFQAVYGLPYNSKAVVLDTWIDVAPEVVIHKTPYSHPGDRIDLFYASTPQRGLQILVPVFEDLAKDHPETHLHVYSSFKIYGWDEMDRQFQGLYDQITNHPQMTYHGSIERKELMERINTYHILAFPSTWMETSCRVLMEAMTAGCLCVHPNLGALPDTSGQLTNMYQGDLTDTNKHAEAFKKELKTAISIIKHGTFKNMTIRAKDYADYRFGFENIKSKWESVLKELLEQYPTIESRKFKVKTTNDFIYRI